MLFLGAEGASLASLVAKLAENARWPRAGKSSELAENSYDGVVIGGFLKFPLHLYSACQRGTNEHFNGKISRSTFRKEPASATSRTLS